MLTRLYDMKIYLETSTATYFNDARYVRFNKVLISKYPDISVEKGASELYQRDASSIINDTTPWFNVFVDTVNFLKTALQILNEVAEKTHPIKFSLSPYLFEQFSDLYVVYIQLVLFLPKVDHKKILVVYGICYKIHNNRVDNNYKAVVDLCSLYEKNIWKKIREEFRPFSRHIITGLTEFLTNFPKLRNVHALKQAAVFNILNSATLENYAFSPIYHEIRLTSKMFVWIGYGLLSSVDLTDTFLDLIKVILREGPFLPIFRDTYYYYSKDVKELTKNWKIKDPKSVKESKAFGVNSSGLAHKEIRIYLRHELEILLALIKDTPSLIAPKFEMLLSALSLCKHEIFWFFRHYKEQVKSRSTKAGANYEDNRITSLIFDIFQWNELISDHSDLIREYYIQLLVIVDLPYLQEVHDIVKSTISPEAGLIIEQLIQIISKASPSSTNLEFEQIRQEWYQVQLKFALKQTSILVSKINDVIIKVNQILFRTRVVDNFPLVVSETLSLRELWYFKDKLDEAFKHSIVDGPDQPTHCVTYLSLLGQFPENATSYFPEEQEKIGKEVVALGENYLVCVIERIRELLNSISSHYIQFGNQCLPQNAIFSLSSKHEEFASLTVKQIPPPEPASESAFRERGTWRALQLYERNLVQLCLSLNEYQAFIIYNHEFRPAEYLAEAIQLWLRKYCHKVLYNTTKGAKSLQPPAVFTRQIHAFVSVLKNLEDLIGMDMKNLITNVLLSEMTSSDLGPSDRGFDWIKKEALKEEPVLDEKSKAKTHNEEGKKGHPDELKVNQPQTVLDMIVQWYATFVTTNLAKGTKCEEPYSPVRNGFVLKRIGVGKPEAYCDLVELGKLCELIGPSGVKQIDREILKWFIPKMRELETILKASQADLEKLKDQYMDESCYPTMYRAFKARIGDFDRFIDKSIAIGNVLHFRRLLHAALEGVEKQKIPYLFSMVETAFNQYPRNFWMEQSLLPMDTLAMDLGIDVGLSDHELKNALLPFVQKDKDVWATLPAMYAVSFMISSHWKEAVWNRALGIHENNIHVLAYTIPLLIIQFTSITQSSRNLNDIIEILDNFLKMSAVFLLRTAKRRYDKQKDKDIPVPKDLASVLIFLDLFVENCSLVSRSTLEEIVPYTMLRSMWKEIYAGEMKA
uniref:CYRIA/CYRIB Rac1 binding domain-containing protein n=1 Tax=Arcella intermedia TaxID=1963864 RepID=A0A6B2KWY4_9EUKA